METKFEKKSEKKSTSALKNNIVETIKFVVLVPLIVFTVRSFIAQPFVVNGDSMLPTFETGQYLIVQEVSYYFNEPQRGDIIVFKRAENDKYLIKRVIGLPNETIKISEGNVYIINKNSCICDNDNNTNSEKCKCEEILEEIELDEPYVVYNKESDMNISLNSDEYFVMGDNRAESLDSRYFGAVNKKEIVGNVLIRLIPVNKIDYLPGKFKFNK